MYDLPIDIIRNIYMFDSTFHEKFKEVLKGINYQQCKPLCNKFNCHRMKAFNGCTDIIMRDYKYLKLVKAKCRICNLEIVSAFLSDN